MSKEDLTGIALYIGHHYKILSKYLALTYCDIYNIRHTLVGNWTGDHLDVLGACRCCSNYIFILNLTPWLQEIGQDGMRSIEVLQFGALLLEIWQYLQQVKDNFILFHHLIYIL